MPPKRAKDFEALMPPHSEDELRLMDEAVKAHPAAFPPCIVWEETNTLIEGHARERLFIKHGLTPKYLRMSFKDRQSAMAHAVSCQLSRRNLPAERAAMFAAEYMVAPRTATNGECAQAAKAIGVSERTLRKAKQVAREAPQETIEQVK